MMQLGDFTKNILHKKKIDQLIIDCRRKDIQIYVKKILLDKISIPGIKPMKYTVKRWLRFSGKAMKAMTLTK
jgi:hypothetical protein